MSELIITLTQLRYTSVTLTVKNIGKGFQVHSMKKEKQYRN